MSEMACKDWVVQSLGQLVEARRGITYSSAMLESEEEGLPYINMKSFLKGGGFNPEGTKRFAGVYAQNDLIGDRDLLIANTDVTAGDIVGVPALLPEELTSEKVLYSHHVTRLRINGDVAVPFLYYLLCLPEYRRHMLRIARGTTVLMLDTHAVKRIPIRAPKTGIEQRRITKILSTLDETIDQTEALIAKYQQIKAGLMHNLFTRGVTPDGHLRPTRAQAPHLYNDSPIGWIPKEWEVKPLSAFTQHDITYGIVQAGPHIENGVPYIRTGDMAGDRLVREELLCTSRIIADSYKRSEVRSGEIVCAIRATVGKVLGVPSDLDGANLTQGTARIAPNSKTDPTFLLWAIRSERTQRAISFSIKGTTFNEITLGELRRLPVAAPAEVLEQQLIGNRMDECDKFLEAESMRHAKLRHQKHGLMHDLLTGRVRVKVAELTA